jgi:hypothetical protein
MRRRNAIELSVKKKGGCKIILCFQSRRPPLNYCCCCFFFPKKDVVLGTIFKYFFSFSKGHFSNLTSKNNVILYFLSNLTVLTNGVVRMQLFNSLGGYFITFETSGG